MDLLPLNAVYWCRKRGYSYVVSSSVPEIYFFGRANRYVANESDFTQINSK